MLPAEAVRLTTIADGSGAPLVGHFFSDHALLYVNRHGRPTAGAAIRRVRSCRRSTRFSGYATLRRTTSGDWSEALPGLGYEWLPKAVAVGPRTHFGCPTRIPRLGNRNA